MRTDEGLRGETEAIAAELRQRDPALAERLERVIERLPSEDDYVSPTVAASLLGVSPNTVKKWVREGHIARAWILPGSGYFRISRSEIERIRASRSAAGGAR